MTPLSRYQYQLAGLFLTVFVYLETSSGHPASATCPEGELLVNFKDGLYCPSLGLEKELLLEDKAHIGSGVYTEAIKRDL